MEEAKAVITLFGVGILVLALVFVGFVVYFIFKQLQFVIQAINLYKKMVERQDMIIKLLSDISKTKSNVGSNINIKV